MPDTVIYTVKSEYINHIINFHDLRDVLPNAQVFELKLFKLLSEDPSEIESAFSWMKQMINPSDITENCEYIATLKRTLELMDHEEYFDTASKKVYFREFFHFLS